MSTSNFVKIKDHFLFKKLTLGKGWKKKLAKICLEF